MSVMAPKTPKHSYYKKTPPKKCLDCPALIRGQGQMKRCRPCQADYRDKTARDYERKKALKKKATV